MNYRTLGLSGLRVSAVGLGCMGMSHAYGAPAGKREMKDLLTDAVDMGYTFFDTAEAYGTPQNPHDNEVLLGEALKPLARPRGDCHKVRHLLRETGRTGHSCNHPLLAP